MVKELNSVRGRKCNDYTIRNIILFIKSGSLNQRDLCNGESSLRPNSVHVSVCMEAVLIINDIMQRTRTFNIVSEKLHQTYF